MKKNSGLDFRVICVVLISTPGRGAFYRVFTNDGGFLEYDCFDKLPKYVKQWLDDRNDLSHVLTNCMFISGVPLFPV